MENSDEFNISVELESSINSFIKSNKFIDLIITYNEEFYETNRVILCQYSTKFRDYFMKGDQKEMKIVNGKYYFDLPLNPENNFSKVLDFLYTGKIEVDTKNIISIYKIAVFYGIDILIEKIKEYIVKTAKGSIALQYSKQFISYNMIEEASILVHPIACSLYELLNKPNVQRNYTMEDVFQSTSDGRIFAKVVLDKRFRVLTEKEQKEKLKKRAEKGDKNTKITFLTEEQRVSIVDQYIEDREITNEEKDALAEIADWSKEDSYLYIVKYKCNWLPASIFRKLIKKVLNIRRKSIREFQDDYKATDAKQSLWYPYSWINSIYNSNSDKGAEKVNIINFICTLGGAANEFNPCTYRLMDVKGFGVMRCDKKKFSVQNVLNKSNDYFMVMPNKDEKPRVTLDFGRDTVIKPESLTINSRINKDAAIYAEHSYYRLAPKELTVQTFRGEDKSKEETVSMDNGYFNGSFSTINMEDNLNGINIQLNSNRQALRIKNIEICGTFEQNE